MPQRKGNFFMWRRLKDDTNSEPQDFGVLDLPAPWLRFGTSCHYIVSASLSGKIEATSLLTIHLTNCIAEHQWERHASYFEGKCRSDTFYPRVYHLVLLIQES